MKSTNTTNPILPASGVSRCRYESSVSLPNGNNELDTSNPAKAGRVPTDGRTRRIAQKLIKAKKNFIFSTLNTRTLCKGRNLDELITNFEKQVITALGIQEHRRVHEDKTISYQDYME